MKTLFAISLIIFSSGLTLATHNEIPDFLKVCKQSDPNIIECIKKAVESLRPILIAGMPELGIPSIEPLNIGELVLVEKNKNGFLLKTENVVVNGASKFKLNKIISKNELRNFDIEIMLPKLHVEGKYNVNGQFFTLPVKGNGHFTGNMTNVFGGVKVIGEIIEIDGEKRYSVKNLNMKIKVGKGKLLLNNLFGGDKFLGDAINNAINDHFDALANELNPPIEKVLSDKFKTIANSFLHKFTFMQLFPQ